MKTSKYDPLNQFDTATEKLSGWWERQEAKVPALLRARRVIGWVCLPLFLAFAAWWVAALLGLAPEQYSPYRVEWLLAWLVGVLACGGMVWGLRD